MYIISCIPWPGKKLYYVKANNFTLKANSAKKFKTREDALLVQRDIMDEFQLETNIEEL